MKFNVNVGDLLKKKKTLPGQPIARTTTALSRLPAPGFSKTPTQSVLSGKIGQLSQQGIAEPEIVKQLRTEGYSSLDIDRALRNSLKAGVGEPQLPIREKSLSELRRPETRADDDFLERSGMRMPEPPLLSRSRPTEEKQSLQERPVQRAQQPIERPKSFPTIGFNKPAPGKDVQELIEVTVEEKWKEADGKLKLFESRLAEVDSRFRKLEQQLDDMKKDEYKKEAELSNKVDSYQDSMTQISTKMEGMETALKGALSSVLESNRSLAESVRGLKKQEE